MQTKSQRATNILGIEIDTRVEAGKKYQLAKFESLYEMSDKMCRGYKEGVFPEKYGKRHGFYGNDFIMQDASWHFGRLKNLEATREYMEYGLCDQRTLKEVINLRETMLNREEIKELLHLSKTRKRKRVFSECGAELDIDRVMCADPQHWISTTPGKKTNVMRIGVNMSVNGGFQEADIIRIASYGIIACELLSTAGYNVEFNALFISDRQTDEVVQGGSVIKLKGADEPLDIQRLCGMSIMGVFRAFDFSVTTDILDGTPDSSYGSARGIGSVVKSMLNYDYIIDSSCSSGELEIAIGNLLNPK